VAAGSDTSIAISTGGNAYSWGFSGNYQTGLGTDDDVEVATLIDNTAVRGKELTWAGAGGQFGVLTQEAEDIPMTNGV
jgi:regulator of chromosome condensation